MVIIMFIVSMKMTKTKIIAGLSVLLVAGIFCAFMISAKGASTDVAKNSEKKITGLAAENNEQRIKLSQTIRLGSKKRAQ